MVLVDGEELYDLSSENPSEISEDCNQECLNEIRLLKNRIRDNIESDSMDKVDSDYQKLKTLMPNVFNKKKCNLSKDIDCNCPEGYTFSRKEIEDICRLEPGIDCSIKYPKCIYTEPNENGQGEK